MSAPASIPTDPAPVCLNCGATLGGAFCSACGQSAGTHRFTGASLLHELPHSIWHVDSGLPYTLIQLMVRPGQTIRSYLAGQRVRLFRPVALVLLLAGLASFLLLVLQIPLDTAAGPTASPAEQDRAAVSQLIFKYFAWFTLAMLPLYALLSWALLRRLRYNYVEHLMANALIMGGVLALQILALPLMAWAGGTAWFGAASIFNDLLLPLYHVWAFTLLALGAYRLAGSLWRGVAIAVLGLGLNGVLVYLAGTWLVRLSH